MFFVLDGHSFVVSAEQRTCTGSVPKTGWYDVLLGPAELSDAPSHSSAGPRLTGATAGVFWLVVALGGVLGL